MVFLLIAFLITVIVFTTVPTLFFLADNRGILDDDLLEEYLNTLSDNYEIYQSEYCCRIEPLYSTKLNKSIEKSGKILFLFPYYIEYVGVIPIWSRNKKRIDAMFATGPKNNWKRKKLGLE